MAGSSPPPTSPGARSSIRRARVSRERARLLGPVRARNQRFVLGRNARRYRPRILRVARPRSGLTRWLVRRRRVRASLDNKTHDLEKGQSRRPVSAGPEPPDIPDAEPEVFEYCAQRGRVKARTVRRTSRGSPVGMNGKNRRDRPERPITGKVARAGEANLKACDRTVPSG